MSKLEQSIEMLTQELEPVSPVPKRGKLILYWVLIAYPVVWLGVLLVGPLRPGVWQQLLSSPLLFVEFIAGVAIAQCAAFFAMKLMVPGEISHKNKFVYMAPLLLAVFALWIMVGPGAVTSSELGHRDHCSLETYLYAIVPGVVIFLFMEKGAVLRPTIGGVLAGMAGALPGAIAMHIACMYEKNHILQYHLLPVVVVSLATGVFYWWRKKDHL